ncbi:hypothetical protein GGI07_003454 [Coemansia sp. Benny D115]|nr:hypothetical protein GGI07_003454 [Coemansia sp. Benny D115]
MESDSAPRTEPEPHISEGVRYHKLLSVLDRSLSSVVDTFKLEDIRTIFPSLAQEIPEKLAESHEQISSYLRNSTNADFQSIIMQYDMAKKLASLDRLVGEAVERRAASSNPDHEHVSPNTMTPESINRSRSAAIKRAELARLESKLAQIKEENSETMAALQTQREAMLAEQRKLEATMELVNKVS